MAEEWTVRKRASEKANHTKWHINKNVRKEGCRLCYPPVSESESELDSNAETVAESRPDPTRPDQTRPVNSPGVLVTPLYTRDMGGWVGGWV